MGEGEVLFVVGHVPEGRVAGDDNFVCLLDESGEIGFARFFELAQFCFEVGAWCFYKEGGGKVFFHVVVQEDELGSEFGVAQVELSPRGG